MKPDQINMTDRPGDRVFGSATAVFAALLPETAAQRETLARNLRAAGYYLPSAPQNLAAIRYMLVMASLIVFGGLLLLLPSRYEVPVLIGLVLVPMLCWAVPALYVSSRAKDRRFEIERAMPDLLDLLTMCVGQGLTVTAAMARISRELRDVYPALSQELRIVSEQAEVGTLRQALKNFAGRIDVPEVQSFTSLLIQTERMGTSVADALAEYSDGMREGHRQQADEKANKAAFQLLFPTVLCLMPAIWLFLLGPAAIEFTEFFGGSGRELLDSGTRVIEDYNANR
ncbi:MAG: type II secretion system F family protein [Planctomycetaceae bacterium]